MKAWPVIRRLMIYFWVAALLLTAVTVARYTSLASGGGSAEIAIPVIKLEQSEGTGVKLKDDVPKTYSFSVSNNKSFNGKVLNSDVEMTYSVLVTVPKTLPLALSMSMKPSASDSAKLVPSPGVETSGDNTIYTYTMSDMLFPAGRAVTHSFGLTVQCTEAGVETTGDVGIDVIAVQAK